MRPQICGTLAAVTVVSCQTPPPSGSETGFKLCVQLSESSGPGPFEWTNSGDEECVDRPPPTAGATTVWSDWAYDSNRYDPDGVALSAIKINGGVPSSKIFPH